MRITPRRASCRVQKRSNYVTSIYAEYGTKANTCRALTICVAIQSSARYASSRHSLLQRQWRRSSEVSSNRWRARKSHPPRASGAGRRPGHASGNSSSIRSPRPTPCRAYESLSVGNGRQRACAFFKPGAGLPSAPRSPKEARSIGSIYQQGSTRCHS